MTGHVATTLHYAYFLTKKYAIKMLIILNPEIFTMKMINSLVLKIDGDNIYTKIALPRYNTIFFIQFL